MSCSFRCTRAPGSGPLVLVLGVLTDPHSLIRHQYLFPPLEGNRSPRLWPPPPPNFHRGTHTYTLYLRIIIIIITIIIGIISLLFPNRSVSHYRSTYRQFTHSIHASPTPLTVAIWPCNLIHCHHHWLPQSVILLGPRGPACFYS